MKILHTSFDYSARMYQQSTRSGSRERSTPLFDQRGWLNDGWLPMGHRGYGGTQARTQNHNQRRPRQSSAAACHPCPTILYDIQYTISHSFFFFLLSLVFLFRSLPFSPAFHAGNPSLLSRIAARVECTHTYLSSSRSLRYFYYHYYSFIITSHETVNPHGFSIQFQLYFWAVGVQSIIGYLLISFIIFVTCYVKLLIKVVVYYFSQWLGFIVFMEQAFRSLGCWLVNHDAKYLWGLRGPRRSTAAWYKKKTLMFRAQLCGIPLRYLILLTCYRE